MICIVKLISIKLEIPDISSFVCFGLVLFEFNVFPTAFQLRIYGSQSVLCTLVWQSVLIRFSK